MLNLYSVYSALNVRRLCGLLCPAISFLHFHVLHFHVRHFHVQHFQRPPWTDRVQILVGCRDAGRNHVYQIW